MASLTPFIMWLLCVILASLILGTFIKNGGLDIIQETSLEGFQVTSCPIRTTKYVTYNGNTNCCNGDIVNKKCNGNVLCTLSPKRSDGIPSCSDLNASEWQKRSLKFCTEKMPHYFGTLNRTKGKPEGCSASSNKPDGSEPQDSNQPKCIIYNNTDDDYSKPDSCVNLKALEQMMTPIPTATKQIVPISEKAKNGTPLPALFTATYLPPNGSSMTPITCYDWPRAVQFLNARDPSGAWKSQYNQTDEITCYGSKAKYVDMTAAPKADPRCLYNGKKLGILANNNRNGNAQVYTLDECKKLGGGSVPDSFVLATGFGYNDVPNYGFCYTKKYSVNEDNIMFSNICK